jgi:hypothetical protein
VPAVAAGATWHAGEKPLGFLGVVV